MDGLTAPSLPIAPLGADLSSLAAQARAGDHRAVEAVANAFEGLFASQLVKQLRQTLEPGTLFAQDSSDVLGGLFDFHLGQHLAQAGGLGIAAMIRRQLEAYTGHERQPQEPLPVAERSTGPALSAPDEV